MRRRVVLLVVVSLAVVAAGAAALTSVDRSRVASSPQSTGASERFFGSTEGISFAGFDSSKKLELDSLRGKPLVINSWASWCLFCLEEMPDFQKVYEDVSGRVEFLGVNIQDDVDIAKELVEMTGVRYPLVADPKGDGYKRLRGVAMPTTWFVDERGRIVERFSGPLTADELRKHIRENFGF